MGQHHQLFVIAKAGRHYRSLAAVHHQWLYGMTALRQCLQLLEIFGHSENRLALQQELRFAEAYYRNKGAPSQQPPELQWADRGGICPFPFITTCLMMGTSFNQELAQASAVHEEPFGMGFDQGDNNDGITVIDITDLENVKYCFVNFTDDYQQEGETHSPLYQPLTGWQYVKTYYPEDDPMTQTHIHLPKTLDTKPLINIATLAETWPWGKWEVRDAVPSDTNQPEDHPVVQSLVDKSMDKIVEALLVSTDMSEFNAAKDQIEALPNSVAILKKTLLGRADQVGKTPHSVLLLRLAYTGETHLDWAPFTNLDIADLRTAFEAGSFASVKSLNLSGTLASRSPSELPPVLAGLTCLKSLYLLERPDRPYDDEAPQAVLGLASSDTGLVLEKVVVSAVMSIAIRLKTWLPDTNDAPDAIPGFPIAQLLVYHKNDAIDVYGQVAPYEYFFLGDALISPARFVNALLRYVQTLNSQRYIMASGSGSELAACIALGSSVPGNKDIGEIGPLPAQAYKFGKNSYHSSLSHGCYSEMRNLKPGQWTVLLGRNAAPEGFQAPADKGFEYAFVRCKSDIKVRKPEEGERDEVMADNLEVYSLQDFLAEAAPSSGSTSLEPLINQLRFQVGNTGQLPSNDDVLRCMNAAQSRDLLVKFMDNIPTMDLVKERARMYH
ncbi:unnamed protein product [Clonostachys byssicola]|uniref:Uncharacterized protein n=1 Tax=Clonostachys byssicola TaxID=160290 RepID=A0A9N9U2P0_9HYPO|nr:unnamed protein product [Clonostachys byssicola]